MCQTSSSNLRAYEAPTGFGHQIVFTTISAGNMSTTVLGPSETTEQIGKNRHRVEYELGVKPGATRFVSQIHSNKVVDAGPNGWGEEHPLAEADALVSVTGQAPLGILVADCLPVGFTTDYGPSAIAHAGRVGLLNGILENTVKRLRELDPERRGRIFAVIGPSICGRCYEVPSDMLDQGARFSTHIVSETSWGTPALDLPAAAVSTLSSMHVDVVQSNECTFTSHEYYSHRRQPGRGRIAGFVVPA